MGAGDADHRVTKALHEAFQVHGDDRLVLDDEDLGGDLASQLPARFLDKNPKTVKATVDSLPPFPRSGWWSRGG